MKNVLTKKKKFYREISIKCLLRYEKKDNIAIIIDKKTFSGEMLTIPISVQPKEMLQIQKTNLFKVEIKRKKKY